MSMTRSAPGRARGFTLLEVLVAFIVLSIGLLGLATLQGISLQGSNKSLARSISLIHTYDMVDRMRANLPGVVQGAYDSLPAAGTSAAVNDACLTQSTGCTAIQLAGIDGAQWQAEIADKLPGGQGAVNLLFIDSTATPIFQIDVGWQEINEDAQAGTGTEGIEICDTLGASLTCFRMEVSP